MRELKQEILDLSSLKHLQKSTQYKELCLTISSIELIQKFINDRLIKPEKVENISDKTFEEDLEHLSNKIGLLLLEADDIQHISNIRIWTKTKQTILLSNNIVLLRNRLNANALRIIKSIITQLDNNNPIYKDLIEISNKLVLALSNKNASFLCKHTNGYGRTYNSPLNFIFKTITI